MGNPPDTFWDRLSKIGFILLIMAALTLGGKIGWGILTIFLP